jgi:plasmid maintenance system antidote protein VapI
MAKKQAFALTAYDAREIVKKGELTSELEMERAVRAKRLLRLMKNDQPGLELLIRALSDLIIDYESKHWSDVDLITDDQMRESDLAERQVDRERSFFKKRKELIVKKLKENELNQNDLSVILSHSKSYTSELLNGVRSFSLSDLVIIHKLFDIRLEDLICTEIPPEMEQKFDEAKQKAAMRKKIGSSRSRPHGKTTSKVIKSTGLDIEKEEFA